MAAVKDLENAQSIDLSKVPTELLKQELDKRKKENKILQEKLAHEKICCKNCAYRIYGKTKFDSAIYSETWVCKRRPKLVPKRNAFGKVPDYNQAYYACDRKYDGCKKFLHKDSERGKKITAKNKHIYSRVIE